jgi:Protein of unknown function (DUF1566)
MQNTWIRKIGIVALVGGFWLVGYGLGGTPAAAVGPPVNPLAGVTQNWDKNLPSTSRFTVLSDFGGAAVRDNNTGLVWEQAPSTTQDTQLGSAVHCVNGVTVGGMKGWRLPSVVELGSLVDPTSTAAVRLPTGHPFSNVQSDIYWSATTVAVDTTLAWIVNFGNGFVGIGHGKGNNDVRAWCVRGPMNADAY